MAEKELVRVEVAEVVAADARQVDERAFEPPRVHLDRSNR